MKASKFDVFFYFASLGGILNSPNQQTPLLSNFTLTLKKILKIKHVLIFDQKGLKN